eukprot:762907-Hanusia_phi.AAC.4
MPRKVRTVPCSLINTFPSPSSLTSPSPSLPLLLTRRPAFAARDPLGTSSTRTPAGKDHQLEPSLAAAMLTLRQSEPTSLFRVEEGDSNDGTSDLDAIMVRARWMN